VRLKIAKKAMSDSSDTDAVPETPSSAIVSRIVARHKARLEALEDDVLSWTLDVAMDEVRFVRCMGLCA